MCQDSKSKKVKYFPASLLTIANSLSIIAIANSVKPFVNNRISVVRHGNGVTARANRNAVRKFSDTKQENYTLMKGVLRMNGTNFMRVEEVAEKLNISKSYAYKIVQMLNAELKEKGILTISGRVNRKYFMERTCYGTDRKE